MCSTINTSPSTRFLASPIQGPTKFQKAIMQAMWEKLDETVWAQMQDEEREYVADSSAGGSGSDEENDSIVLSPQSLSLIMTVMSRPSLAALTHFDSQGFMLATTWLCRWPLYQGRDCPQWADNVIPYYPKLLWLQHD
ncbi:Vacuolar import and degradation 27 [Fusarium albosuccineum]|uniref:Vacuolar import and degradation 27 n=1 Tax=Fusarium albosuccineum TaxID=1237068 RepID=A0A8H4PM13_9HYPO|nr:Vacuolar import and degradation 27 [Fusarium albosuccineum]